MVSALRKLIVENNGTTPYNCPNDIQTLAPHLELAEIDAMVSEVSESNYPSFIGPPTCIRGAEHLFFLRPRQSGGLEIVYSRCYRRKESFLNRVTPPDWGHAEFSHREIVSNYAELTWGDSLHWDVCHAFLDCRYYWPDRPGIAGAAGRVVIGLGATWPTLLAVSDQPMVVTIMQNTLVVAEEEHEMAELLCTWIPTYLVLCAYCGGGLGHDECHHCRRPCVLIGAKHPCRWPLPAQTARKSGVTFAHDPVHAVQASYMEWCLENYVPPPSLATRSQRERVVKLRGSNED